tara:strand:+ start:2127 stop:3005 length:879 start_codon:yes stop_codon:yes gene_type:complete
LNKKNKIFWIASYPKSGNTLMRAIIASLFFTKTGQFKDFNLLSTVPNFDISERILFIKEYNIHDYNKLSDLYILSKYWHKIQNKYLESVEGNCFFKTHSALVTVKNNQFTNKELTKGFFYLVRDPRDIAISYATHLNIDIDSSIQKMINSDQAFKYANYNLLNNEKIVPKGIQASWDIHIKSWTLFDTPKMIIKYEDMIIDKEKIIRDIILFFKKNFKIEFDNIENKIINIINTTSFDNMEKLEIENGFKEIKTKKFFNVGKKEQWKKILNQNQIKLIEKNFKKEMINFGYL